MIITKYRAWDKTTDPSGKMVSWEELKKFPGEAIFINAPLEIFRMQFTGHVDIKKAEVYSEDILKGTMAYGAGMTQRKGKECLFLVKQILDDWGYCFTLR